MKKKYVITAVAAAAALLLAVPQVRQAVAYFSTYVVASGQVPVELKWETALHEEVENNNKHIIVENTGETEAQVRVAVFAGDYAQVQDESNGWSFSDGWWYYRSILKPGESTSELFVEVNTAEAPEDFNIIVVHESGRIDYESDGSVRKPDATWTYVPR